MNKLIFFLKFYRTQKMRFFLLVFIFAFAGAILSCTLLIYGNNKEYYQAQMKELTENHIMSENAMEEEEYTIYEPMEKILTVFSLCSILIVIWGCTSILFSRIYPCRNRMPCFGFLVCKKRMFSTGRG